MDATTAISSFEGVFFYVIAASIAMARMTGLILIMPAFTRLGLTGIVRSGIALALAVPLVPVIVTEIAGVSLTAWQIGMLLTKELLVGIVIGLVLGVPFWAAEAAGDVLDLQRGSSIATLIDPTAAIETTVTGTVFAIAMLALFYSSDGLTVVLRALYGSYGVWPIDRFLPLFSPEAGGLFVGLLDDVVTIGLMLVVPVVVALLLADVVLALVARAAPHMHIFDLSLAVKNLVFVALIALYCSFLMDYMGRDLGMLLEAPDRLQGIGNPGPAQ